MKETRQEKAYNWVISKIKENTYSPGMSLKEEILAKEIGISPTPVREALRRLEREGWVEFFPYRGCFIKKYVESEIRELCILRQSLEEAAIVEVIDKITQEQYQELDKLITDSYELVEKFRNNEIDNEAIKKALYKFDSNFHARLIEISQCKKLISLAQVWNFHIYNFAFVSILDRNEDIPADIFTCNIVDQHKAILTAIKLKWKRAAQELVRAHILSAYSHLLKGDL